MKLYHSNDNIQLEGQIKDDLKYGNIKEYYDNGKLQSEIEYLIGKRNGKAKE